MTDQTETTNTDVALPSEQQAADVARANNDATGDRLPDGMPVSDLVLWAYEARQARSIARALIQSSFVPDSLLKERQQYFSDDRQIANVTATILTGSEIGLKPMAALRSLDIIKGTPALRAHAMRALLQAHGHQIEMLESDAEHCVMRGRRYEGMTMGVRQYGGWQTVTWTMERARAMGLTNKDTWQNMPEEMLLARATSQLCRLIASDVIHAVPYASEELADGGVDQPVQARVTVGELTGALKAEQAPQAQPEKARQEPPAPAPAPEPAPEVHDAEIEPDEPPAAPESPREHKVDPRSTSGRADGDPDTQTRRASPRQKGTVHMLAGQLGFKPGGDTEERAEYLAELSALVNRDVVSSNDLSSAEASICIEMMQRKVDEAPE